MGCDIHLRLEKRLKKEKVWNEYYTEKCEWQGCHIFGSGRTWGDRIYGMFAVLADVRNEWGYDHIPIRGLPEDASNATMRCYGYQIKDVIKNEYEEKNYYQTSKAEKWVSEGLSKFYTINGIKYCSSPDYHSPNWCTTQEMEDCINKIFKDKNENWEGEPYEWLALLGAMKGYEATGEYECRAVFWFDN